jgi:glycine/D-amino acid oxidase-like deaminating enzyme
VTHLLEDLVSKGVNLQTNTPVTGIDAVERADKKDGSFSWTVKTPRGAVKCGTVIHATNGYSAALLPEMHAKIVPVKGMVARLVPKDGPKMTDSFMMRFSEYEYDYMIPRPDGSIIVGGARRDFYHDLDQWFDVSDDSSLIEGARHYFDGYMQRHFRGWESVEVNTPELWTGSK